MNNQHDMQFNGYQGFVLGVITGTVQYILNIDVGLLEKLFEAAVTAFVSGGMGIIGNYIFAKILKKKYDGSKAQDKSANT